MKTSRRITKNFALLLMLALGGTGFVSLSFTSAEPTALEIIKKATNKMQGASSTAEIRIVITRPKWTRTMELKTWTKGTKYSMTLITAPARDKGTVFLKREKEIWNWVPTVERTIKLPPSMMAQSWMGTDLTNDDLIKESSMETDFKHSLLGKENAGGRLCYKIASIPTDDAAVVWGKVVSWIDTKDYITMKSEFYDEDMDLVNTFNGMNIKVLGGKTVASKVEIIPADKPGQKTTLEYLALSFDQPIQDAFFTVQNMKKVK